MLFHKVRKIILPTYGGVYKIVNIANGKIYVGSTGNFRRRWDKHLNLLCTEKHNKHIQNAFRKYGKRNFICIIQERVEDKNQHVPREQIWIDYYKSYLPENGYNIRRKAESNLGIKWGKETRERMSLAKKGEKCYLYGKHRTKETKEKISLAQKGEKSHSWGKKHSEERKKAISLFHKGRHHTEEARQRISESHKGVSLSEEHKRKISDGKKGKTFSEEHKKNMRLGIKKSWDSRKNKEEKPI